MRLLGASGHPPNWQVVADALREKNDGLARMMDASREDVLAYMDFPREHWAQRYRMPPVKNGIWLVGRSWIRI